MTHLTDGVQSIGPNPARDISESEHREQLAAADRRGWFAATHASDGFGILARNGREVCRCDDEHDRDHLLRIARAHDAMREALQKCQRALAMLTDPANTGFTTSSANAWMTCVEAEAAARDALNIARGNTRKE